MGVCATLLCAVVLALVACAPSAPREAPPPPAPAPPPPHPSIAAFAELSQRYLDEFPEFAPVTATQLGDHRYDAAIDDLSPAGLARYDAFLEALLGELDALDLAPLSRASQVDAQLLRRALEYQLWQHRTLQEQRWNPLLYTQLAGDAIYSLTARDYAPLPQRLAAAGSRLEALPQLLAQERESLDPARVPKVHAETAASQNAGLGSLIDTLVVAPAAQLPDAERERVLAAADRAKSAIAQHQLWLEKRLVPQARGDFRIGATLYDEKLRFALASMQTRAEIRARAESELTATRASMYDTARQVLLVQPRRPPLPDAPTPRQQQAAIAAALELAYASRPARDAVLEAARQAVEDARKFVVAKQLVTLYDDPLAIIAMPEFQQGVALAYCDAPGPLEVGQQTFFAVSPIPPSWTRRQVESFLREYNTRSIANLAIHEVMPGHFVQLTHANRYPSKLRAVLASGTFIEGWAVYAERMMVEQGFRGGDPLMRLIQQKWYLRAVANALLDQGVQAGAMTREQALALLTRDAFQEEREAAGKWTRAQLTATQLSTYFVGAQEHLALRAEAEQRAGGAFELGRYHDTVLSFGSPPVRYVRALMFDLAITP
jgi:uncharacterized protein (DUF885 family)